MPAGEAFVLTAEHERQYRTDGYTVGPRARELQDPRACALRGSCGREVISLSTTDGRWPWALAVVLSPQSF